jgi:hypothetical protein
MKMNVPTFRVLGHSRYSTIGSRMRRMDSPSLLSSGRLTLPKHRERPNASLDGASGMGLMPKPIQHQIGEPKSWRSGCPNITGTHGDIKSQTPISGLGLTRDNLRLHTWRASFSANPLRLTRRGSRVRVFGIQAELLLSLISVLISPASAQEKRWFPFETGALTTYYVFRSINILD